MLHIRKSCCLSLHCMKYLRLCLRLHLGWLHPTARCSSALHSDFQLMCTLGTTVMAQVLESLLLLLLLLLLDSGWPSPVFPLPQHTHARCESKDDSLSALDVDRRHISTYSESNPLFVFSSAMPGSHHCSLSQVMVTPPNFDHPAFTLASLCLNTEVRAS